MRPTTDLSLCSSVLRMASAMRASLVHSFHVKSPLRTSVLDHRKMKPSTRDRCRCLSCTKSTQPSIAMTACLFCMRTMSLRIRCRFSTNAVHPHQADARFMRCILNRMLRCRCCTISWRWRSSSAALASNSDTPTQQRRCHFFKADDTLDFFQRATDTSILRLSLCLVLACETHA